VEHWYVYYKLPAADLPSVLPMVRALQARLGKAGGAEPRLQARLDTPEGIATVMEIYADIADPAAFGERLDAALRRSGLPAGLLAGRRTERFRDL
jgi:D-serine deaminase-like pyridoxal phosphate-dependent protein